MKTIREEQPPLPATTETDHASTPKNAILVNGGNNSNTISYVNINISTTNIVILNHI